VDTAGVDDWLLTRRSRLSTLSCIPLMFAVTSCIIFFIICSSGGDAVDVDAGCRFCLDGEP